MIINVYKLTITLMYMTRV